MLTSEMIKKVALEAGADACGIDLGIFQHVGTCAIRAFFARYAVDENGDPVACLPVAAKEQRERGIL